MNPGQQNGQPECTPTGRQQISTSRHQHHDPDDQSTARDRRIHAFNANAATWQHLQRLGLTSQLVADTLQQILREAA